jgi:hypothetical protein
MLFAAVVLEASWKDILKTPPQLSKLVPKTIIRSVLAWQQRYPRVHWWDCDGRRMAELITFRILQRFYQDWKDGHGRTSMERRSRRYYPIY